MGDVPSGESIISMKHPMNRLTRIGVVAFIAGTAACSKGAEAPPTRASRPNILWVVSEDNTFNYVGATAVQL